MKKHILISVNVIFFSALLAVLIWPKCITGDYCEFTITSLSTSSHSLNGDQCSLLYSYRATSHTSVFVHVFKNDKPHESSGGYWSGFPYWPKDGGAGGLQCYRSNKEQARSILRVNLAEAYQVTIDEPLLLYDFKDEAGDRYHAIVRVSNGRDTVFMDLLPAEGAAQSASTTSYGVGP